LSGCGQTILSPIGPVGASESLILLDSLAIMLAIVTPTILAVLLFAWWYRASNSRAKRRPTFAYSGRLELLVWSIPALTIMFLGGLAWIGAHDLDPARPLKSPVKPLEVQVVSMDWKWLFIYPQQGVASVNLLAAPVGVPLHLSITSASVFNVFFVPRLGSEIYSMNGMATQLNLMADRTGVFPGLSAHFSGDGFSGMGFSLNAMSPQAFSAWVAGARSHGPALDPGGYGQLSKPSQNVAPFTYRSVAPGLFDQIVLQKLPPEQGPPPLKKFGSDPHPET
jgi:cytochrome o ubiquinol oxidase subunit 2